MKLTVLSTIILILLCSAAFAQVFDSPQATELGRPGEEDKADEKRQELNEKAFLLLRQTSDDVSLLRTAENRIGFTAELAALLWHYDEKQARELFAATTLDFRSLAMKLETEMNMFGRPEGGSDQYEMSIQMMEGPNQAYFVAMRKMQKVMMLRSSIAMSIVKHDPELAYNFYYDSVSSITNKDILDNTAHYDTAFETQFLRALTERNASKAAEYGLRSLKNGVEMHHVSFMKQLYDKDAAEGIKYGEAVLSKVKSDSKEIRGGIVKRLLETGKAASGNTQPQDGKPPLFSRQQLREIAEILGDIALNSDATSSYMADYADVIEEFAPGKAAQIRTKFKKKIEDSGEPTSRMADAEEARFKEYYEKLEQNRKESAAAEQKRQEELDSLKNKELPPDQRHRIINEARQISMSQADTAKRITGLIGLAMAVRQSGDIDLSKEIMGEAAMIVNPYPKTYVDYMNIWILAAAYAEVEPDRAFMYLENFVPRANELISAFSKIAEFIDINEEIVIDNEFQVGAFGGGMLGGMTQQLGAASNSIGKLAEHDFDRLAAVANRFELREARVLAKMLIIREVLDTDKTAAAEERPENVDIFF